MSTHVYRANFPWPDGEPPAENPGHHTLRIIAIGHPHAVQNHIASMHSLGYAEPNDWTKAVPTGHPHEIMRILAKRIPNRRSSEAPPD